MNRKFFNMQPLGLLIIDRISVAEALICAEELVLRSVLDVLLIDCLFNFNRVCQIAEFVQSAKSVPYCFLVRFAQVLKFR
jgi:hypothetical protein